MSRQTTLLLLLILLASCGSKRKVVTDEHFARELSQSLGLRLTPRDNLLLYAFVDEWQGVPYRYGGKSKRGTDCSHFTTEVIYRTYRKRLQRSSDAMYRHNIRRISRKSLREGDLVFFSTQGKKKRVNHVGIYLKQGFFTHASTSRGVTINHLDESYFQHTWVGGGRIK